MAIRDATVDDLDDVRRVARRSWETDYPDILTRETAQAGVDEWYDAGRLTDELARGTTQVLVEEREGDVVGFAHVSWSAADAEGYVVRLYVDPDHRRAGIGRDLLEEACDVLFERGVERINATVLSANEPGKAFYEQFGFGYRQEWETTIGTESYPESRYVLEDPTKLREE